MAACVVVRVDFDVVFESVLNGSGMCIAVGGRGGGRKVKSRVVGGESVKVAGPNGSSVVCVVV